MNLVLTNPAGFWALLGIPAVVLIHFLQRQARVIPISTLFLLARTQRESARGRRFDRLTNSIPLWLQLLMVLLLTWLMVEPRYVKPASTQQVAVVLDSSASMGVFKDRLMESLANDLPPLRGNAARLQLYVFESEAGKPILYAGESPSEALEAVRAWQPAAGSTDPNHALRLARSRVRREGVVVYATDTPVDDLPFNARLVAVGEPAPNVGFTGASIEREGESLRWSALVRNYSDQRQSRSWQMRFEDGSRSEPRELVMDANGMTSVTASFPPGARRLLVALDPDAFTLDDELPLVRPAPKTIRIFANLSQKYDDFRRRFIAAIPNLDTADSAEAADLALVSYDPLLPMLPGQDAIVVVDDTTQSRRYLRGGIIADKHPLVDGLNWQALLVRDSIQLGLSDSDEILIWQGDRPLVALRTSRVPASPDGDSGAEPPLPRRIRQLIFNFDLTLSNAVRLPATVVLLHRFCEGLRDRKVAPEVLNTETGQLLRLATRTAARSPSLALTRIGLDGRPLESRSTPLAHAHSLRAPVETGFFRVIHGDELLLESACHFADTREADLRECAEASTLSSSAGEAVDRHTREDHLWRLWVLLALAALLLAWHFTREQPRPDESPAPPDGPGSQPAASP